MKKKSKNRQITCGWCVGVVGVVGATSTTLKRKLGLYPQHVCRATTLGAFLSCTFCFALFQVPWILGTTLSMVKNTKIQ